VAALALIAASSTAEVAALMCSGDPFFGACACAGQDIPSAAAIAAAMKKPSGWRCARACADTCRTASRLGGRIIGFLLMTSSRVRSDVRWAGFVSSTRGSAGLQRRHDGLAADAFY